MFSFLTLCFFFFMAAIPSSGRSSKGKLSAEAPSLLEQHVPKNAQALVSLLSKGDRETLNYMLAFGLHMQVSSSKVQWNQWKSSCVKMGLKRGYAFPYRSVSAMQQKASHFLAHTPSCTCDCFSCYASFWSRWADSPHRDLLNMIIEIDEMADEVGERKASKGKEKKKKQEKKHILEQENGGKKGKGGKWELQSSPQTSSTVFTSVNMLEGGLSVESVKDTVDGTSMDVTYEALWDNIVVDALCVLSGRNGSSPPTDALPCRTDMDTLSKVSTMKIRSPRDETSSWAPSNQTRALAIAQEEPDGSPVTQELSAERFASRQSKNNSTSQRAGKCKSNQITPMVFDGTFFLVEREEQDASALSGKAEVLRVADANLRGKGILSRIFPDAVCGIASRLWDLVSAGSQNRAMVHH